METITAKSAGFCFGVKRAIDAVYDQIAASQGEPIYTYGPIIHNEAVVKDLADKGVCVITDVEQLKALETGTVIIRSHGVAKNIHRIIAEKQLNCVDATCPFVKRIHNIVEKESKAGKQIIIIGNQGHPEVEGITGWTEGPVYVAESEADALRLSADKDVSCCIVSQTTFNYNKFKDLVEILKKKGYNSNVVNTICNATEERQIEAGRIATEVDVMIVIGGKHSSNTRKLYEICRKECASTYFIQTLEDLQLDLPQTTALIGITAGASTPKNIIEEVQNYVRVNF